MKYDCMPLGDYQTNCYFVWDETTMDCAVIDPGYEPETIATYLQKKQLRCKAILLTHGHFDHVGAVRALANMLRVPVWIHEKELDLPAQLTNGPLYFTDNYAEGDTVSVGALQFQVLETPGHTMGSVCLLCGDLMFSGDTLFSGSCGRTDLGGDMMTILRSLKRLGELEINCAVLPGHGPGSTLALERRYNPYMQL